MRDIDQTFLPGRFDDRLDVFFAGCLVMDSGHDVVADVPYLSMKQKRPRFNGALN